MSVVASHKEVVRVLAIDCRQVSQEVRGVQVHPTDLAGEERQGIYADAHYLFPRERSWPASCLRLCLKIIQLKPSLGEEPNISGDPPPCPPLVSERSLLMEMDPPQKLPR